MSLYIGEGVAAGDGSRPKRDLPNGPLPDGPAKIVVIAGPAGSGKTTLIRALREAKLPRFLADCLPEAARAWPLVSAKEVLKRGLPAPAANRSGPPRPGREGLGPDGLRPEGLGPKGLGLEGLGPEGLIVHYDIMRIVTLGSETLGSETPELGDYRDDPALKQILALEGPIAIVTLAPEREALFAQFLQRLRSGKDEVEEDASAIRRAKRLLRRLGRGLFGARPVSLSQSQFLLLAIYGSERKLAYCTARWNGFLERLALARDDVRLIAVAPESTEDGAPSFSLAPAPSYETAWRATA